VTAIFDSALITGPFEGRCFVAEGDVGGHGKIRATLLTPTST
jgi:hypothetical protein